MRSIFVQARFVVDRKKLEFTFPRETTEQNEDVLPVSYVNIPPPPVPSDTTALVPHPRFLTQIFHEIREEYA